MVHESIADVRAGMRRFRSRAAFVGRWALVMVLLSVVAFGLQLRSAQAQENQVFGLKGIVISAISQSFSTMLIGEDNSQAGLVGATPAIEAQLSELAARQAEIKVWGIVQPPNEVSQIPVIVASEVVEASSTATATPAPNQPPTATITVYAAYVRSGPGSQYPALGSVNEKTVCAVTGRSTTPGWWKLSCPGIEGWVMEGLYTISGDTSNVPILAPPPLSAPSDKWLVSGYANTDLTGEPVVRAEAPIIDFNWGTGVAYPGLPADNFSLRYERTIDFAPGYYRLEATYDDGVRVYVNNQLVINDWQVGAQRTSAWQGNLSGAQPVRVDYMENTELALLRFVYGQTSAPPPTPTPLPPPSQPPSNGWLATYYSNPSLQEPAILQRVEPKGSPYPLNYEFSIGSPVPGIVPEDNWSARWRGRFYFEGGDYRFLARGNEGVRVYLDGIRLIDAWPNSQDTVSNTFNALGAGEHEVTVEYYEIGGTAWVRTWWERISGGDTGGEDDRDR